MQNESSFLKEIIDQLISDESISLQEIDAEVSYLEQLLLASEQAINSMIAPQLITA